MKASHKAWFANGARSDMYKPKKMAADATDERSMPRVAVMPM